MNVDRYLVRIPVRGTLLPVEGELALPEGAEGLVIFAHGSGSSRHSPRNKLVARYLNETQRPLATLLVDLLTSEEEALDRQRALRFDIDRLAVRLIEITDWTTTNDRTSHLTLGYFGASTGAAAALVAAAERPFVQAIVSRGGRPDLAGAALSRVQAPTLLLVGGKDRAVIERNAQAQTAMRAECRLEVIPNAGHLFEEPGTLFEVARRATRWLDEHLGRSGRRDFAAAHA
jgi:putative phosphoribosyl transferase